MFSSLEEVKMDEDWYEMELSDLFNFISSRG
jgi:hypothetical protein